MKIGLIGINRYAKYLNFACNLHVYAFQQFLADNGYESTIIDYKPAQFDNFDMRHPAIYAENKVRKLRERTTANATEERARKSQLKKWSTLAVQYREVYEERERRYDKFESFIAEHLTFTDEVYNSDLLEVSDPGFDCYMCATDVIWQSIPHYEFDRGFLLGSKAFEGKQKIAYAASRGASKDFSAAQEKLFFSYLDDIDAISVREADFSEYIESRSGNSAPTVLDPVLLHHRDFWDAAASAPSEERFLLLYYVMERSADTIAKAVEYAKLHDLTIVELSDRPLKHGMITDPDVKHVAKYDVGPDEWLGYLRDAECIFTNSFHGCCFAVLFEKPFFVGKRNGQKVPNFLATFGLSDRRFEPDADVSTFSTDINYDAVKPILDARRQESADFLLTALQDAQRKVEAGVEVDTAAYDARRRRLTYIVRFHSGNTGGVEPKVRRLRLRKLDTQYFPSGSVEYTDPRRRYGNDGGAVLDRSRFKVPGLEFAGWRLRFRVDNRWFWYLKDGSIAIGTVGGAELADQCAVLADGAVLPHLPVNHVSVVVLVAQWAPIASPDAS